MEHCEVIFFTQEDGTQPAREFLDGLSVKTRARVVKIIQLLRDYGGQACMLYSEYLRDDIFQIRAQQEGNISRLENRTALLLPSLHPAGGRERW